MAYQLLGRAGAWAQWIDLNAAEGWIAECARLMRPEVLPPEDATPAAWPRQKTWTLAAYRAIAGMAGALDMPIPSFAPWARVIRAADLGENHGGAWVTRAASRVTRTVAATDISQLRIYHRVWISWTGDVGEDMDAMQCPDGWIRCRDRVDNDCAISGGAFGVTGWTCAAWEVCTPGWGTPGGTEVGFLVPLQWHADAARQALEAINAFATLGDLVAACRAYIVEQNTATVERVARGDPSVIDEADVITSAANARARIMRGDGDGGLTVIAGLGEAVHDAAPTSGVTTAIMGVTALPRLLLDLFGRARGVDLDLWGRELPVIETAAQSGYLDPPQAPTRAAPEPPPLPVVTIQPGAITFNWTPSSQAPPPPSKESTSLRQDATPSDDTSSAAMVGGALLLLLLLSSK